MTFLAVAMAAGGADLSDDQSTAVGPATIYEFMLVGGLYNLVLLGDRATRVGGLALYAFAIWAHWRSGVARAADCMDAEAVRTRRFRAADGASMLIIYALGGFGVASLAPSAGPTVAAVLQVALALILGAGAAIYIARRPRSAPVVSAPRAMLTALALGAVLGGIARELRPSPTVALTFPAVALAALILTAEELLLRGALQRGVETELGRAQSPVRARAIAAAVSLALSVVMLVLGGRGVGATFAVVATHAAAVGAYALTGRTTAAWLARFAATGIALLA